MTQEINTGEIARYRTALLEYFTPHDIFLYYGCCVEDEGELESKLKTLHADVVADFEERQERPQMLEYITRYGGITEYTE